jgi:hypothetical protein
VEQGRGQEEQTVRADLIKLQHKPVWNVSMNPPVQWIYPNKKVFKKRMMLVICYEYIAFNMLNFYT